MERGARRVRDRRQDRAGQGARAADARRRSAGPRRRRQLRRRRRPSPPSPPPPASAAPAARTAATSSSARWPTTATRRRPGSGSASAAHPTSSISPRRPRRPAIGRPGCSAPRSRRRKRITVVLDPYVTASFLGIISSTLNGESVAKGRSLFKDRLGESVANSDRHAGRRSHQPEGVHRDRSRRRGPGGAAQRADRRRRAAAVRALVVLARAVSARRAPATRCAAASRARPASGAWRCSCCPARATRTS